ncbi:hypothetical protein HPB47_021580 [Ixodes persulcatus]|uniref:Uncharacterized protein n=1 Tax=Ixodes persulcatus TaxID=34615 RepID=A0AC60QCD8_IXOPE|nr:hypothetical protein HPB47_021580 [Ixodes persulcatus]
MYGRFRHGVLSGLSGGELNALKPRADRGSCRVLDVLDVREQRSPEFDSGHFGEGGVRAGPGMQRGAVNAIAAETMEDYQGGGGESKAEKPEFPSEFGEEETAITSARFKRNLRSKKRRPSTDINLPRAVATIYGMSMGRLQQLFTTPEERSGSDDVEEFMTRELSGDQGIKEDTEFERAIQQETVAKMAMIEGTEQRRWEGKKKRTSLAVPKHRPEPPRRESGVTSPGSPTGTTSGEPESGSSSEGVLTTSEHVEKCSSASSVQSTELTLQSL